MRMVLLAFVCLLACGSVSAQFTAYTFTGTGTGAIPDGVSTPPPAFGTARTISFNVAGLPLNVRDLVIGFDVSHTWVGDLQVVLAAPGGSPAVFIFSRVGALATTDVGDNSDLGGSYIFSDVSSGGNFWTAAATASPTTIIPGGSYRASVSGGAPGGGVIGNIDPIFAGLTPAQANGIWTLSFRDSTLGDVGTVNSASLAIVVGPTVTAITPPTGGVAGGTAVVISGSNFDPAFTTVTFGGVSAAGLVTQTQIQVSSPPHVAGPVDIVVTTAYGSYTVLSGFTYTSSTGGGSSGGDDGGGGCGTGDRSAPWWLFAVVALALATLRIRFLVSGRS